MSNLGERIAELRKLHGVTQQAIADLLGVTLRTAQNYEYMKREPSISQLKEIARFFGVSIDYLVGESDDPTPPSSSEPDDEGPSPEDMAFFEWVKEHVTGMQFYDFQKSKEDGDWIKGLRLVYEKEKGRKPGQKQGE